jgi:hypothetical protein
MLHLLVNFTPDRRLIDTTAFKQHLDSLCSNPTYGILTPKQVRHNIADQLLANQMAQLQL